MIAYQVFRRPLLVEGAGVERVDFPPPTSPAPIVPDIDRAQRRGFTGSALSISLAVTACAALLGCTVRAEEPRLAIATSTLSPAQRCAALSSPQPAPPLIDQYFDQSLDPVAACFLIGVALTPDGRNIALDPASASAETWIITAQDPTTGTLIDARTPMTVWVDPVRVR